MAKILIVEEMFVNLHECIDKNGKNIENELEESAQTLQKLYVSINDYLASMYSEGVLTEEQASQSAGVLYVLCDIDRIGILFSSYPISLSFNQSVVAKIKKHFNQFTMSLLFCVILSYRFFLPLYLPLSECINTDGTI